MSEVEARQEPAEMLLAKRIAKEDHFVKQEGSPPLLLSLDRLALPLGDPAKHNRFVDGAKKLVKWMNDSKQTSEKVDTEMRYLRQDFSKYIRTYQEAMAEEKKNKGN